MAEAKRLYLVYIMESEATPPSTETDPADPPADKNTNTMGMLCHLLAFCGFVGVPAGNIIGPLIMWLIKREECAFVDACGKESVNFQISMTIYTIIAGILVLAVIGLFVLPALIILNIVLTIIASIQASEGKTYQYPFTIRFIK